MERPISVKYESDLLTVKTNHDFLFEDRFIAAISAARDEITAQYGGHGMWNFHILLWCATQAMRLPGDIVQCGVFNGTDAAAMIHYTNFGEHPEKTMYLLDTFTGVPEEQWSEEELRYGANSAQAVYKAVGDRYESVVARFKNVLNVHVIRGKVPETLAQIESRQIAALFLDMNAAAPEKAALEYLWDRVVLGGIVFSDDYGHGFRGSGFYQQKLVFDAFAASVGHEVMCLPTGQGLIIKTTPAATGGRTEVHSFETESRAENSETSTVRS